MSWWIENARKALAFAWDVSGPGVGDHGKQLSADVAALPIELPSAQNCVARGVVRKVAPMSEGGLVAAPDFEVVGLVIGGIGSAGASNMSILASWLTSPGNPKRLANDLPQDASEWTQRIQPERQRCGFVLICGPNYMGVPRSRATVLS
jgi:hypothetical protein